MRRFLMVLVFLAAASLVYGQSLSVKRGENGKGLLNEKTGRWVVPPTYMDIDYLGNYEGVRYYAVETYDNLWGFITSKDYSVYKVSPRYSDIKLYGSFQSLPVVMVERKGNWGLIELYTESTYEFLGGIKYQHCYGVLGSDRDICVIDWAGNDRKYAFAEIKSNFDNILKKEKEVAEARARQKEEAERLEKERIRREQKERELASFTEYAKAHVTPLINEWQKKGEFEKLSDYQQRVTGANRLSKIEEFTRQAEQMFIAEHEALGPIGSLTLEQYDSENEVFGVLTEKFGRLIVPVPITEGQEFKNNFNELRKENATYFIADDKLALSSLTFVNPSNGKSYMYNNAAALNYVQYNVNLDELDIESLNFSNATASKSFVASNVVVKPTCEILSPSNGDTYTTGTIVIKYKTTVGEGLSPVVKVTVNGQNVELRSRPAVTTKGVKLASAEEAEIDVPRSSETPCIVTMTISDSQGNFGEPKDVKIKYVGDRPKPTLHLFSVGVSEYQSKDMTDLAYAAKDAKDFVNAVIAANNGMYGELKTTILFDKDATANNVRGALKSLAKTASQGDVIMVFFSGHGVMDGGDTYFMTSEVSRENCVNAVDFSFISGQLNAMANEKKCRVVLFMDTCHSGAMYGMKGALRELSQSDASIVRFLSCTSNQQSAEMDKVKNGVFTSALLQGLKGAACNEKGEVTLYSLESYVKSMVQKLSDNNQSATVENRTGDAVLFRMK